MPAPIAADPVPPTPSRDADPVVVIGAGLAGLTAATTLANAGHRVRVLERRAVAGGHCGRFVHAGHAFTTGCNDFGGRIVGDLAQLGAAVRFARSTVDVRLGEVRLGNASPLRTTGFLLRHAPGLWRLIRGLRRGDDVSVGALVDRHVRDPAIAGLLGLLAYAIGTPLHRWRATDLAADFSKTYGYGHTQAVVPVDGAQAIVDALLARLRTHGVEVETGSGCLGIEGDAARWVVRTDTGEDLRAAAVISSMPPRERATATEPAGLAAVQCLFVLRPDHAWGPTRTSIVMPAGAPDWLARLDAGELPTEFGFHGFRDHVDDDATTVTAYALAPRGCHRLTDAMRSRVLGTIVAGLDRVRPGFESGLLDATLIDPHGYATRHGLGSELSAARGPDPAPLPTRDPVTGVLRVGNGIGVPGDHVNAAMLSGLRAAAMLRVPAATAASRSSTGDPG